MANIGKKGLELPKGAPVKTGGVLVSQDNQTSGLTSDQKFSLVMAVSIGFGIGCLLAMLAMLSSWLQFANNSFNDYTRTIREYENQRYIKLEERVHQLEITPTLTPTPIK